MPEYSIRPHEEENIRCRLAIMATKGPIATTRSKTLQESFLPLGAQVFNYLPSSMNETETQSFNFYNNDEGLLY